MVWLQSIICDCMNSMLWKYVDFMYVSMMLCLYNAWDTVPWLDGVGGILPMIGISGLVSGRDQSRGETLHY